jgi:hypothetical protein
MNDILFWTWAPGLLILVALFGLLIGWIDRHERDKHRQHPAE